MRTRMTEMLAIDHPLLLAPMGSVSGGALAAGVSAAGGLGLIGAGYGDAAWLRRELALCRDSRFGVGFITWALAKRPSLLDLVLDHAPVAVMFSFGDCRPFIGRVHESDAKVICQVQNLEDAIRAVDNGADIIVAQGTEAGGHGASRGTLALVPAVVDAVAPVPVVAAGGIADGRGLAASLMLGACGVLVGTRFFATFEALGAHTLKEAIVNGTGDNTLRTRVFDIVRGLDWPPPYTGRALRNQFIERWHGREAKLEETVEQERNGYWRASAAGDTDTAVVFCSEAVDLIDAVVPAGEVVASMVEEAGTCLARWKSSPR